MSGYEINDTWSVTEFVEENPYNKKSRMEIVLEVNWREDWVNVKTYCSEYYTFDHHHGIISLFNLPENLDASKFPEYYAENVLPLIKELSGYYEEYWDGNNTRGKFNIPDGRGYIIDKLEKILSDAPTANIEVYDYFGDFIVGMYEFKTMLADEMHLDIATIDPEDSALRDRIYEHLIHSEEPYTHYYIFGDVDDEIEEMLKELVDESVEEDAPVLHEFKINGVEAIEKTVASGNKSSARINVPPSWQGKKVMVVRLE